jgi:hypothetical protein
VLLFPILAGNSRKAFAQSDWERICGFTNDPLGAAFKKAKVTVKNQSGVERQAPANESGSYVISKGPPGFYRMTAEAAGFRQSRIEALGRRRRMRSVPRLGGMGRMRFFMTR